AAVLDLGVKIAGALESAHRIGVLHRDIKPENVLLSRFGEPKLADFGIASVAGRTETRSGSVTASIAHAAPEILNGERPTVATDVYSLASTLYTLLTGGPAFVHVDDETVLPIVARIAADPVPDLRPRGVPDALCRVVEQGMAKEPGARQGSALEIARRLQDAQIAIGLPPTRLAVETEPPTRSPAAPVPSPPPPSSRTGPTVMAPSPPAPSAPPPGRVERRRPKAVIAAGVLFALAVASAVAVWLGARSPSPSASPPPTSSAPAAPAAVDTDSVVFRDDFSSAASGWATGDKPEESITYAGGRYVFRVEISPYTQVTDTYFEGDAYRDALTKLADVAVEVTVLPGGNPDAGFGVMCRGRYLAFVTGRGAWTLQRLGAEPAQLASGTAPLAGTATDPRRLRLECSGAENGPVTLTFSVDGNVVGRTVDPTGLGPGSVGLAVTTASGPFDGAFDDFVVRRL
ncbi:MAG: hypothetical protein QOE93_619, partial [Actinomycetota bacterium]|nr:hypothetical protein [Actinomycetota bacterium]